MRAETFAACGCGDSEKNAESSPLPADPRVSPMATGLHNPADSPSMVLPSDNTPDILKPQDVLSPNHFQAAEENLAIQDVEVWGGMVIPEGTGQVMGQATPATDFTPFGVSAETDVSLTIPTRIGATTTPRGPVQIYDSIPAGDGRILGQYTANMDYAPSGMYGAESLTSSIEKGFGAILGIMSGLIVGGFAMGAVSSLSKDDENRE